MIKTGIVGGESIIAGEIIRMLVLHPDVELVTVFAPALRGRSVCSIHRGLVGDTNLRFSDSLDYDGLDIIFVTDSSALPPTPVPESLKIVLIQDKNDLTQSGILEQREFVPGVSEMFRKRLVRGATASKILSSPESVALIVLFPLALNLLLNDSLTVKILQPLYKRDSVGVNDIKFQLEQILKMVQLSFGSIKGIFVEKSNLLRTVCVEIEFDCNVTKEEIERIYNQTYDDHNFTFLMKTQPVATEVSGTQKCLLFVSKPTDGRVKVTAIADSFLRGGAGDAVHAMNLLFGLHEKTGLSFPASMAFKHDEVKPEEI